MEIELLYLPNKVRLIYEETILSLKNKSPILAGIGLRVIIETICLDNGTKGDSLFEKIDNLVKDNVLTPAGSRILYKIRTLDDNLTHQVDPHNDKQLHLAMSVVENILNNVYVLPTQMEVEFGK